MSGAAFGFHAVGDVLRETNIFQSNRGLASDGIEEALILVGIRLLRKRQTKNEQTNKMCAMADQGHQTFGRERGEREIFWRIQ